METGSCDGHMSVDDITRPWWVRKEEPVCVEDELPVRGCEVREEGEEVRGGVGEEVERRAGGGREEEEEGANIFIR